MQLNVLHVSLVTGKQYLGCVAGELFMGFCAKTEFAAIAWCRLVGEEAVL